MVVLVREGNLPKLVDLSPPLLPTQITRSAFATIELARPEPFPPITPIACESVSGIDPFPLKVVATGIPKRLARRHTSASALDSRTPPPATNTGRSASATSFAAARISSVGGLGRDLGKVERSSANLASCSIASA